MLQTQLFECNTISYKISYKKINNELWFLANDIAQFLHIKPRTFSKKLKIIDECDKILTKNYFSKTGQNAIFINENAIIDLILNLKSTKENKDIINKFKKFIRKLVIKQSNDTILKLQTQLDEANKQLEISQEKTMVLENFTSRIKPRKKTQIFYIATSTTYAQKNRFKFGGVENENKLSGRLATYNTGRMHNDKFYFSFISKVVNYRQIEQRLKDILPIFFKDGENYKKEMVHCHYDALLEIINFILKNYNEEIEFINEFIKKAIQHTMNCTPVIPKALTINCLKITISKNDSTITKRYINLDDYNEAKQKQIISGILEEFEKNIQIIPDDDDKIQPCKCINRKDFEKFVKQEKNYVLGSRKLWKILKNIIPTKNNIKIKY